MRRISGEQIELVHGGFEATVTEVGATLRLFRSNGRDVLFGFDSDAICLDGRGQVLAPWPNRLEDGEYVFAHRSATAPVNEAKTNTAIHGLMRWLNWTIEDQRSDSVELSCRLAAQPAYPFEVVVFVSYVLRDTGLEVVVRAQNLASWSAPFGIGFHPYLQAGELGVDGARLHLPARRHLIVNERQLPVADQSIEQSRYASLGEPGARGGATLRDVALDDCFSSLSVGTDRRWRAEFFPDENSPAIELWADEAFGYLMCFSGDTLAKSVRRRALALEPMTCPPNAFRTQEAVIELAAQEEFSARWGILPHV